MSGGRARELQSTRAQDLATAWNDQGVFRFGVVRSAADGGYMTSGTYKLAVGGRDSVYFFNREARHHMKVSLHAREHWQLTYDGRHAGPAVQHQRTFGPGHSDHEGKIRAIKLLICDDAVTRPVDVTDTRTAWVAAPQGVEAIEFHVWLVPAQRPEGVVRVGDGGTVLSVLPLPSGMTSVLVVAFPSNLPALGDVVFTAPADSPEQRLRDRIDAGIASTMFWWISRNSEVRIIEARERIASRIA